MNLYLMILKHQNWWRNILILLYTQDTQSTPLAIVPFTCQAKAQNNPVKVDFYITKEEGNAHIQCSRLSYKGDTYTVYVFTTAKFSIHTTHFQI